MKKRRLKTVFGFKSDNVDETEYLKSSKANKRALDESIQQVTDGKVVKVCLNDLWKL